MLFKEKKEIKESNNQLFYRNISATALLVPIFVNVLSLCVYICVVA